MARPQQSDAEESDSIHNTRRTEAVLQARHIRGIHRATTDLHGFAWFRLSVCVLDSEQRGVLAASVTSDGRE